MDPICEISYINDCDIIFAKLEIHIVSHSDRFMFSFIYYIKYIIQCL